MTDTGHEQIILASRSPRRETLLKQIGIFPKVIPADIDESVLPLESPIDYVVRLSKEKALSVYEKIAHDNHYYPVLAADTTVVLNHTILGKPIDANEAFNMLHQLAGTIHHVHTAVAVCKLGKVNYRLSSTLVEMMPLTNEMIKSYIASGESFDKAGAYGIQGFAGAWIKRIEGSYTGVMGLPLYETACLLNQEKEANFGT